jgi:ABC-type sulfate/molybdate transport systems ATPase subunit
MMIKAKNITKHFGKRAVLRIESLTFQNNVRYALLGANGSGKSTLLRILAGTLDADSGTVQTNGLQPLDIGYLPQIPYAFIGTVLQNVAMALPRNTKTDKAALQALESVGMHHLAQERGNRLSGGETQRMALARILAVQRQLLLLDEPTSCADIAGIDLLENALHRYCAQLPCTVVFSTHSPAQAARLADEIIFLEKGIVAESGPADRLLTKPESEEMKRFLSHWKI